MRNASASHSDPRSFRDYARQVGFANSPTALSISVDSIERLPRELKDNKTMVFRLGSLSGERHTRFALAQCQYGWEDYFLIDRSIFASCKPDVFVSNVPLSVLRAFSLLPAFTETSAVNFALASGLLAHALGINKTALPTAPATGQSTFSFPVRPHSDLPAIWQHESGQVEFDALFVARRNGMETLFVLEAKTSTKYDSLAKHKLVYPLLALDKRVPPHTIICPVYMRMITLQHERRFCIAECTYSPSSSRIGAVNELNVAKAAIFTIADVTPA